LGIYSRIVFFARLRIGTPAIISRPGKRRTELKKTPVNPALFLVYLPVNVLPVILESPGIRSRARKKISGLWVMSGLHLFKTQNAEHHQQHKRQPKRSTYQKCYPF
jgi:hypothetical protein